MVGFRGSGGGGGRPALPRHKRLPRKRGGSSRDRIPKESETLSQRLTTNLRSQRLPSQRPVSSQRFDGLQRSQSLQSQRLETNQGASRSCQTSQRLTGRATHLTQWAMLNDQSHGSSGGCRLKEACCAKGRFSAHKAARPKGVPSLAEAQSESVKHG